MNELTKAMVVTMKDAAKKMTGANRRAFEAQAALDYLGAMRGWRQQFSAGIAELSKKEWKNSKQGL